MLKRISRFFHNKQSSTLIAPEMPLTTDTGWHLPLPAKKLLDTPLRQQYLTTIWQNVSMSPEMFKMIYQEPIERYAEMVQLLPASESHHHAHIGGMLDHGLEVIAIATKLRQRYILPQNVHPEEQAKQRDIWTAVIIYAALLHDIGKCAVDIEVVLKDGQRWFPWQGIPMQPYNFRYIKARDYQLHPILGGFFANKLIPQSAIDWIALYPQAFSSLMYFIAGHTDKAGILSEIIQKADQTSVTLALGGDPTKLAEQPKTSFAKQLLIALRQVISGYKLNESKGGNGWLTEDGLWVMSKSMADSIRAVLLQQGIAVPSQNGKLFDELQAHKLIDATPEGKAIWKGKITSNSGWTHEKPFTLLKISPQVIWESIEQRPIPFDGRVEVVNDEGEIQTIAAVTETEVPILDIDIAPTQGQPNEPQHKIAPVKTPIQAMEADKSETEFVLDLFPITHEYQQEQDTPQVENVSAPMPKHISSMDKGEKEKTGTVNTIHTTEAVNISPAKKREKAISLIPSTETNPPTATDINAVAFVEWIKASLIAGTLFINKPRALVHQVNNHLFLVTPGIFKVYLRDVVKRTDDESWKLLQKRFQILGIHRRQHLGDDSQNIWTCSVTGPNRKSTIKGFLLPEPQKFIGNKVVLNNQWLTLQGEIK